MAKVEPLNTLTNLNSSAITVLNENFTKLVEAIENTVSRDGSTPNSLSSDLDLNNNDILNAESVQTASLVAEEATIGGKVFTGSLEWKSAWLTSTAYKKLDLVSWTGSLYVCLESHTSGLFASDLVTGKWEPPLENVEGPKGDDGEDGSDGLDAVPEIYVQAMRPSASGPWVWWCPGCSQSEHRVSWVPLCLGPWHRSDTKRCPYRYGSYRCK